MFKKLMCAFLAMAMVVSLSACGNADTSSEGEEIEYVTEYVYENESGTNNNNADSSNKNNANQNNGNANQNNSSNNSSDKNSNSNSNSTLDKLKGTTVKFATWKDPNLNEDGPVVQSFQKKYGIKVEIVNIAQSTYSSTIQGLISSGKSPDIYFCNGDFPAALSCLQPISVAKLDTKDSIWDKSTFEITKFKGESYLCNTVGNIWNEVDCLVYNKVLWKQAGINNTPAEFDKAGKWNWDTLEQIMTAVSKLKNCSGGTAFTESLIYSTGCSIFSYENGTFKSGLDDSFMIDVNKRIATWYQKGIINQSRDLFAAGKSGVFITNAYALKKTGYLQNSKWDDLGCYYIPDYDSKHKATETGIFRGWGIIRGAKNPEAAGVFLRYYLDVNNYNTSDAFINSEAETFFFQLTTGGQSKKNPYYAKGTEGDSITGVSSGAILSIPQLNAPEQVQAKIASYKNSVTAGAKKLNEYVNKNTGVK